VPDGTAVSGEDVEQGAANFFTTAARHALPRHGALDRPARLDRLRPNNAACPMTALRENFIELQEIARKTPGPLRRARLHGEPDRARRRHRHFQHPLATSGGLEHPAEPAVRPRRLGQHAVGFHARLRQPQHPGSALTLSKPCMTDSTTQSNCSSGCTFGGKRLGVQRRRGPPYQGGRERPQRVAYDPNFYYPPASAPTASR